MPTVAPRMHVHTLRSSKSYFTEDKRSQAEMFAKQIVDMLPRSPVSRSILRTFGIEYNGDNQAEASNALASNASPCISHAAHSIPGIIKQACSPSSVFLRSSSSSNPQPSEVSGLRSLDYSRQSMQNRILNSISASQENTPPLLKLSFSQAESTSTSVLKECSESKRQSQINESRALRSRISTQHNCEIPFKGEKFSKSTSEKSITRPVQIPKTGSHSSRYVAFSRPHYYQPHFDVPRPLISNASVQKLIEIPSWRVNNVAERYTEEFSSVRVLRSRDSQPPRPFLKRHHPTQDADSDGDFEDTSDEAYRSRHIRLETEEIKQERLSLKRIAEEEFRIRLEQRERKSWQKRQPSRVDSFSDIDPNRFMPFRLVDPFDKVQTVHVREEIPLIAFGVRVPKPKFMSSVT